MCERETDGIEGLKASPAQLAFFQKTTKSERVGEQVA